MHCLQCSPSGLQSSKEVQPARGDGECCWAASRCPELTICMKTSARRLRGWLADLRFALSGAPVGEPSAARAPMTLRSGAIGAASAQHQGVHRTAAAVAAAAAARASGSAAACARPQAVPQQLRAASLAPADRKRSLLQRAAATAAGSTGPSGTAAAAVPPGLPHVLPFPAAGLPSPPALGSSLPAAAEAAATPAQPSQPAAEVEQAAAPIAAAAAAASVSVEGTVRRITFRADDTGYTVLRLQLAPGSLSSSSDGSASEAEEQIAAATASASAAWPAGRGTWGRRLNPKETVQGKGKGKDKQIIIVVGNLPQIAVGQTLRLRGRWVEHRQYGLQLQVRACRLSACCLLLLLPLLPPPPPPCHRLRSGWVKDVALPSLNGTETQVLLSPSPVRPGHRP